MLSKFIYFQPARIEDWIDNCQQLVKQKSKSGQELLLLLVGEETPVTLPVISKLAGELGRQVVGGIFPGLIVEEQWTQKGVIACLLEKVRRVEVIKKLAGKRELLGSEWKEVRGTVFILVDGLACGTSNLLESVFEICGGQAEFIGGGAGSLVHRYPSLFTANDWFNEGAVLIEIDKEIGVGTGHGWLPLFGPVVANKVRGNVIEELNWQPAFTCYQNIIRYYAGTEIDRNNFFMAAKNYPLGILKADGSVVVRDPIALTGEQAIILVGEVPENSVLVVLRGDYEHLISEAANAAAKARTAWQQIRERSEVSRSSEGSVLALLIDCVSRLLYLGEKTSLELSAIRNQIPATIPVIGFMSIGEIASRGGLYPEFLNKSTVVGVG